MYIFILSVALFIILIAFYRTKKMIKCLFLSFLQGFASLFAVNFIGSFIGVHLPLNLFTCTVSGLGGISGVIFLLLSDILTKIG